MSVTGSARRTARSWLAQCFRSYCKAYPLAWDQIGQQAKTLAFVVSEKSGRNRIPLFQSRPFVIDFWSVNQNMRISWGYSGVWPELNKDKIELAGQLHE